MNTFTKAIKARISASTKMSAKNIDALKRFASEIDKSEKLQQTLTKANLNVRTFENDVYEIEKMRNLALLLSDEIAMRDLNEMTRCVLQTALNFEKADKAFTRKHATQACSAHYKLDKNEKALIEQNKKNIADSTVASQHRSSLAALENLNIVRSINKSEYRVNRDSEMTKALCERLAFTFETASA